MTRTIELRRAQCAAITAVASLTASAGARAQDCQNQIKIDVCKAGCTATSETCGALCDFTSGACWVGCQAAFGTCDLGCDTCDAGCEVCCALPLCGCGGCRDDCDDCRRDCNRGRDNCEDGCRLDCDECIFNCQRDCESICRPFRKIGQSCIPLIDRCADGLICWPFPMPGESHLQCFPTENDELFSDDFCRSMYVSDIHETAILSDAAYSFGTGGASAVGVATSTEAGVVYGEDGRFGCYFTDCIGATVDVEFGIYASAGVFESGYEGFRGESVMTIEEAGKIVVGALAQFFSLDSGFLGLADILSIEASLVPITAGAYDCFTIVDTVGMRRPSDGVLIPVNNSAPQALCAAADVCADRVTCVANASVNGGSVDPDGDALITVESPTGPFGIGERDVTLTVTDPEGASDSCTALVTVNDCDPPEIVCPAPTVVGCEGNGQALVDPGDATTTDCTAVTVTNPGTSAYPVGTTVVAYTATDAAGNASDCTTTVTVVDEAAPVITGITATPEVLWPPNHRMQEVHLSTTATDSCDPDLACEVVHVTSDEPDAGFDGEDDPANDVEILGPNSLMLRAERSGEGGGRVYTLTVRCVDVGGNTAEGVTTVMVPHDQRDHASTDVGKSRRSQMTDR